MGCCWSVHGGVHADAEPGLHDLHRRLVRDRVRADAPEELHRRAGEDLQARGQREARAGCFMSSYCAIFYMSHRHNIKGVAAFLCMPIDSLTYFEKLTWKIEEQVDPRARKPNPLEIYWYPKELKFSGVV